MPDLTVTLIQTDLVWEDKKQNLLNLEDKINHLKEKTELIILPEMFSTGFSMRPEMLSEKMDGESVLWMKRISASKKIILTGSLIIEENGEYYNRLIWMLPNSEMGIYDKRHLFAYGTEHEHYTAGNKRLIASVKGWKINLQVCYDLRFPLWARQQKKENADLEYDVLIYVANWPQKRNTAWKTLLQARAIENQCYVIGVNRTGNDGNGTYHSGDSMVIDAAGEILYHASEKEDVFTINLKKEKLGELRSRFPFWKDADNFLIVE